MINLAINTAERITQLLTVYGINLMLNDFYSIKQEKLSRQKRYAERVLAGDISPKDRCVLVGCRKSKVNLVVPKFI